MDSITLKDDYDDTLDVSTSDAEDRLYIDITEDGETVQLAFGGDQESEIRNLRNYLSEWLGYNEQVSDIVRASDVSFNEGILRVAAVNDKTVSFRYAKGGGSVIETRVLKPAEVKTVKDHQIVVGFDPDRDEARSYRLDRIKGEVSVA